MRNFKLHSNGFIYLHHPIDRKYVLRISTKMKIDKIDWDKGRGRPKKKDAIYNGYNIVAELLRYENILTRTLALQPDLTWDGKTGQTDHLKPE